MIRETSFDGVKAYVLQNERIELTVTEYGASVLSLKYKGQETVLSFPSLDCYEKSGAYLGATVGRYANRIGGASFSIGGRTFTVDANEGANCLHGGNCGKPWNKRWWIAKAGGEDSITFSLQSPDGDNGFPGSMTACATYTLLPDGVKIGFTGISDADTYYAPTNHTYFSLGTDNVLKASLRLESCGHLEVDEALIPTGRVLPNTGRFDFSVPRMIGTDLDDCFVMDPGGSCTVTTEACTLTVRSDFPAIQVYTGAFLDGGLRANAGIALEPEYYPDSPNKPDFPNALLKAGETFSKFIEYTFA